MRGPEGQIFGAQERLNSILHRNRFARAPFFRGVVVLYETLVIGTRWLMRSGSLAAAGEGVAMGRARLAITLAVHPRRSPSVCSWCCRSFVAARALRRFGGITGGWLPVHRAPHRGRHPGGHLRGLPAGGQPIAEIGRVFQYHGAEHMTIHVLEHDDPLTVDEGAQVPHGASPLRHRVPGRVHHREHHLFSLLAGQDLIVSILGRILLIPVVAAVAYEVLRWGAKRRENWAVRWLFLPGIWLQAITTQQPDDSMIEVAIASMQEALAANGETAPEGSLAPVPSARRCRSARRSWPTGDGGPRGRRGSRRRSDGVQRGPGR